jgi:hypothetical protein
MLYWNNYKINKTEVFYTKEESKFIWKFCDNLTTSAHHNFYKLSPVWKTSDVGSKSLVKILQNSIAHCESQLHSN